MKELQHVETVVEADQRRNLRMSEGPVRRVDQRFELRGGDFGGGDVKGENRMRKLLERVG